MRILSVTSECDVEEILDWIGEYHSIIVNEMKTRIRATFDIVINISAIDRFPDCLIGHQFNFNLISMDESGGTCS